MNEEQERDYRKLEKRGWDHFSSPFEIEKLDISDRFNTEEEAREAHRKECGCPWPEFDLQDAFMAWVSGVPVMTTGENYDEVAELNELGSDREEFLQNMPRMLQLCTNGIDRGVNTTSWAGAMSILKQVAQKQKEGTLNKYQFSNDEGWIICDRCGGGVPPDEKLYTVRGQAFAGSRFPAAPPIKLFCGKCTGACAPATEEYANIEKMTDTQRIDFIKKWSRWFYDMSNSFEGELGLQLAYLWPAIANGNRIEVEEGSPILGILVNVPKTEFIWNYIDVVPKE